jgi:hypothetical protein
MAFRARIFLPKQAARNRFSELDLIKLVLLPALTCPDSHFPKQPARKRHRMKSEPQPGWEPNSAREKQICEALKGPETYTDIKRRLGIGDSAINRIAFLEGYIPVRKPESERDKQICEGLERGESCWQLGEKLGISHQRVAQIAKRMGLVKNRQSEPAFRAADKRSASPMTHNKSTSKRLQKPRCKQGVAKTKLIYFNPSDLELVECAARSLDPPPTSSYFIVQAALDRARSVLLNGPLKASPGEAV